MTNKNQLKLYNSLSKKIEVFTPKDSADTVSIYHCGPTVYKRQHIGNMRRFLFADFLHRSLEFFGYKINEVTNITDVGHLTQDDLDAGEDKLEKEAKNKQTTPQDIAEKEIKNFFNDLETLNIRRSNHYPKATENIERMQNIITKLLENGHAYEIPNQGIYYDVQSFPEYGKLSGNRLENTEFGKRLEIIKEKRHPADFALWILDTEALQKWDSPWGVGYPGWHIECSAMSARYLKLPIDIHTGGEDNRFPHHENEIAQSEGAFHKQFVKYWMHNAHLQMDNNKMSKSEGKQITVDTIIDWGFSPLAFRLLVFGSHYRQKIDFSRETLTQTEENLTTFTNLVRRLGANNTTEETLPNKDVIQKFSDALADDLNTPAAYAVVLDYVKDTNRLIAQNEADIDEVWCTLMKMDVVIGVFKKIQESLNKEIVPNNIIDLANKRKEAREQKDFIEADRIREEVEKLGYLIEDTAKEPRIVKK